VMLIASVVVQVLVFAIPAPFIRVNRLLNAMFIMLHYMLLKKLSRFNALSIK
jgi:hypothetical protein